MHLRLSLVKIFKLGGLLVPLFFCSSVFATDLSQSLQWLNLLHYENGSSHLDSKEFFLGTDSSSELKASLAAIGSDRKFGKLQLPFECAYPARAKILQRYAGASLKEACPSLKDWLAGLAPESLSLVFASYYPNNPASIFGHTFLKINTSKENKISDYAVNYLAITGETNGILFGLKGLLGFYRGQFNILPYFLKINEYNHSESRDMYEYVLELNNDEVDTLLRHVWELENNGYFDYYFLDDNCSYFILRLLDVARPSLHLARKFQSYVIPSETMKAVHSSGLSSSIHYRPSLYSKILQEKTETTDRKILVQQFKKLTQKKWSPTEEDAYHKLLIQRSQESSKTDTTKILPDSYPHETHAPLNWSLAYGQLNEKGYTQFTITPGVHDLLSPQKGYLPFSSAEVLRTSLRIFDAKQLFLDRFTLIDIKTLNPHQSWNPKLSWKSRIEYSRFDQSFCEGCSSGIINYGAGKTLQISDGQVLSLFLNAQTQFSSEYAKRWTYGIHPELHYHYAGKLNLESSLSLLTRLEAHDVFDSMKFSQGIGFTLGKSWGLRLRGDYYAPVSSPTPARSDWQLAWVFFQ